MSALLVALDGPDEVRKTLRHVHAQDAASKIEVVLVCEDGGRFAGLAEEFPDLAGLQLLEFTPIDRMGPAKAAGVEVARGGLVVQLEDHAYPQPGWARALLQAWRQGEWSGVSPAMANANPDSGMSWANLFADYGRWVAPSWSGEREALPGHNSALSRELLMEQSDLGADLDDERAFFHRLGAQGHRFYLTADARVDHQNVSNVRSSVRLRYYHGRLSAADRARGWSFPKRVAHVLATPLIPVLRFRDAWEQVRASGVERSVWWRMLPSLIGLVTVGGIGEGVGYALGPGDAPAQKARLEDDCTRHLNRPDKEESDRELRKMATEHP
jgi:hypothetical protein